MLKDECWPAVFKNHIEESKQEDIKKDMILSKFQDEVNRQLACSV